MAPDSPSKLLMLCPPTLHPLQCCSTDILSVPWATKLSFLRAFAHALTSILTVLWLGLVCSFLIFFLHIWFPFLEKHFLIAYVGYFWLPLRCTFSLSLPGPMFWDALTGFQAPWLTVGVRRSEGGERSGIYSLSSFCDESRGRAVSTSWDLLPKRCFLQLWTASSCAL